MALTKEETFAKLNEQENKIIELQEELTNRPEKIVVQVNEVVIENSSQSETLGALGLALSKTQSEFKAVKKTTEGYGYSYADLTSILSYAQPIYTKYELSIVQMGVTKMLGNTPMAGVKTILIHSSGEWISSEMYQPTVKSKQNSLTQNIGIVNAYFRRYMVQSLLGLSTEDNDGKTE